MPDRLGEEILKEYQGYSEEENIAFVLNFNATDVRIDEMHKEIYSNIKNEILNTSKELEKAESQFLDSKTPKWQESFAYSENLYTFVDMFTADFNNRTIETNYFFGRLDEKLFVTMLQLQNRVMQIYLEVLCLLKNGYPDGAFGRWRTMYEVVCVMNFILSSELKTELASEYLNLANKPNREQSWDWAKISLKKQPIYFADIQKKCELWDKNTRDKWKKEYKTACLVTHPTSAGTFRRIGDTEKPSWKSFKNISLTAGHSAQMLSFSTTLFMGISDNVTREQIQIYFDGRLNAKILQSLTSDLCQVYKKTEEELNK